MPVINPQDLSWWGESYTAEPLWKVNQPMVPKIPPNVIEKILEDMGKPSAIPVALLPKEFVTESKKDKLIAELIKCGNSIVKLAELPDESDELMEWRTAVREAANALFDGIVPE